ncbi:MAG: peptidoglycan DD-metalloendopeptidase family protein [Chloroflexota bacterium]
MRIQRFSRLFILIILTACNFPASRQLPADVATLSSPTMPSEAAPPTQPFENPPLLLQPTAPPSSATPLPDPYSIHFSPPITDTVASWRPPLYPTPWMPTPHDHFLFSRPILANTPSWALADYRYGGVFFRDVVHTGIDIPLKNGTDVYAAGSGRVNWSGFGLMSGHYNPDDPYGLAIVIRHDFGYQGQTLYSVYGHLSQSNVVIGQHVEVGEIIGLSGDTGNVTGPHLHFEVRIGDNSFSRSRNPELWISPPQGWGILAGRLTDLSGYLLERRKVLIRSLDTGQRYSVASYGDGPVNSDPYYQENLVIGDLPAGWYRLLIPDETSQHLDVQILPGRVTFFTYVREGGFSSQPPAERQNGFKTPLPPFTPTVATPTP